MTDMACKEDSNWKQYAIHAPDVSVDKIAEFNVFKEELMQDAPVQQMPVQSLITKPSPNEIVAAAKSGCKSITVKGLAWGGGGLGINRVDVSLDNGKNFTRAELLDNPSNKDACRNGAGYFLRRQSQSQNNFKSNF